MWLTYHVLGIQINHSINELLSCRVPAGASKPGLQAWSYLAGTRVMELAKTHPDQGCLCRQRDVTGPAFLLSVHGLATLLWEAKDSSTVEAQGHGLDRAMLLQVWHDQNCDGATLDWHSWATKPWKGGNTLRNTLVCKEHWQGKCWCWAGKRCSFALNEAFILQDTVLGVGMCVAGKECWERYSFKQQG